MQLISGCGIINMEDEDAVVIHYSQLLEDFRSVSCQLETLRRQHETHLSELGQKNTEIDEGEGKTEDFNDKLFFTHQMLLF